VPTLVRTIVGQPDRDVVFAQHRQVIEALEAKFPGAAEHFDKAREDILAFAAFPKSVWKQTGATTPRSG
jgi:putative transposase